QGSFFDDGVSAGGDPQDINGWFEMQSFRAREVPVLARLLSLGSFTGIADTLSGDGIAFDVAQFKFTVHDGRLRVKSGRFNGPALGLTTQGAFNARTREVDFGGTVVPAYGINSVLENVPLIGRVLTGREGEGVFGFSYRVDGTTDDLSLLVNPLSVLTPGILRRVFEIGIGELPEVTVTDDDLVEDEFDD
ncbi:MAG: AsmA-like C-terminal domain-containing protein, partial [Pseudomonadota bacterium]|nr:AsmA-like C-terminal domain-containing protein [Pseudomonadota bacterium]